MTIEPTVSDAETLLPCPFCGGKATCEPEVEFGSGNYRIGCEDEACLAHDAGRGYLTPAFAIAAWNRRSAIPETEVKPLEWRESSGSWFAATPFGGYTIEADLHPDMNSHQWSAFGPDGSIGHFVYPHEAKAAARADYEARIRSALV